MLLSFGFLLLNFSINYKGILNQLWFYCVLLHFNQLLCPRHYFTRIQEILQHIINMSCICTDCVLDNSCCLTIETKLHYNNRYLLFQLCNIHHLYLLQPFFFFYLKPWIFFFSQIFLSGTLTAPARSRLKDLTVTCTSFLLACSGIHLLLTQTNWFSVRSSNTTVCQQVEF